MKYMWMSFSALPKGAPFIGEDNQNYVKTLDDQGSRIVNGVRITYSVPAAPWNSPLDDYVRIQGGRS